METADPNRAQADWSVLFPPLISTPPDKALAEFLACGRELRLEPRQPVFFEGAPCERYLLVAAGSVRVFLTAENGREVTLYRVHAGESCVLTTSCLLGGDAYPAAAVTEDPVRALIFDLSAFRRALDESAVFRRFVFAGLGARLATVIRRFEELNFGPLDRRLAELLLRKGGQASLVTTHQALAAELGTAREVVSRHLEQFARRSWLRLGRGRIEILDGASLARLAKSPFG
jgi:CRP/FNR family transcriptional regulator, anaerobic regulatory protein